MSDGKEVKDADRGPHESWCDTQNNISERCNCMASSYIDSLVSYETVVTELRAEVEALKKTPQERYEAVKISNREITRVNRELQSQDLQIATQARVIQIAKRVLHNAGLRPPDGGTPTVETICEDLNDAIIEIAAIEKEETKDG